MDDQTGPVGYLNAGKGDTVTVHIDLEILVMIPLFIEKQSPSAAGVKILHSM